MEIKSNRPLVAIVDDDVSICQAMKRLMSIFGIDAETFASGNEFVERLDAVPSFHPDCVILDVEMAGLNGLEVQAHLARKLSEVPMIFVTAADDIHIRRQALAAGAIAFLSKPVQTDLLVDILRAVLKLGVSHDPSA